MSRPHAAEKLGRRAATDLSFDIGHVQLFAATFAIDLGDY